MKRGNGNSAEQYKILSVVLSIIALTVIVSGIATSIYMNLVNRSFYVDEAMLAYSFSKRSFWILWDGALDWLQSAPLGWLYFEKVLSVLFGNTEFVLRIGSILFFVLSMVLLFVLLKYLSMPTVTCISACAFYANMPFILKYSNMFKPYIADCFFVLIAICCFYLFDCGHIHTLELALVWGILIWFSTPVCFFEGGLLISAGLFSLIKMNTQKLKSLFFIGIIIATSFVAYYLFWIGNSSIVQGMQDFWEGRDFPLIPRSMADVDKIQDLTKKIFRHLGPFENTFFVLFAVTIPLAVKRKQKTVIGCYFGILLSLFASWLNMFPVQDRIWCFFYPLTIFLAYYGISCLSDENGKVGKMLFGLSIGSLLLPKYDIEGMVIAGVIVYLAMIFLPSNYTLIIQRIAVIAFSFFLVFSVGGVKQYWINPDEVYMAGEELNSEITYLEDHLKSDEHVHVYRFSVPGFQFKNGYDNYSIAGYDNNVTFGSRIYLGEGKHVADRFYSEDADYNDEIASIVNREKVYIVSSHVSGSNAERLNGFMDSAHKNGYIQLVSFEHSTPLWFFCRNIDDSKIKVTYETESVEIEGEQTIVKVLLKNVGEGYINHNYEDVVLYNTVSGDVYNLEKNISPGSNVELTLMFDRNTSPTFVLKNEFGPVCVNSDYIPETQ